MMPLYRGLVGLMLALMLLGAVPLYAQVVQPVPALTQRVIDQTATLSAVDRQALEMKLAAFEQSQGTQLVVLMVTTTQPEDIASFANRVANTWKIGRRDVGDGLLLIVAKNDRKMRIEVAKSLEGAIPDIAAARIIDQQMAPRFRTGDFAGGLQAAIEALTQRIAGEKLPVPEPQTPQSSSSVPIEGDGAPLPIDVRLPRSSSAEPPVDWMGIGLFLLVGAIMIGSFLRRLFGKLLGPLLTGVVAGGLAFVITTSVIVAAMVGFVAFIMSFLSAAAPVGRRGPVFIPGGYDPFARRGGGWGGGFGGRSRGGGWGGGFGGGGDGGGGGFGTGSDEGGGFSSGGGGDFGGGGASGNW